MGNSAHSHQWQGPSSRALRLSRKLGRERLDLKRLEKLLKEERDDDQETDQRKPVRGGE